MFAAVALISCSRDEGNLQPASFPTTAEVFTDVPVGLTDQFFISFDPAAGANTDGFGVDENEAYEGTTSIRIEVPSADDPNGNFIGGIFKDRNSGRNLTGYNTLSFWAKGSTTATVGTFGFGDDFEGGRYAATISEVRLSTSWKKYYVPIPDPSKLTQEKGMFLFSAGTQSTNGAGYTIWIDEIRFEDTGLVAQPLPQIFNGEDQETSTFNEVTIPVAGASVVFNVDGTEVPVSAAPSYFDFEASNPDVASVDESGTITVNSAGTSIISASIGSTKARGSLEVNSAGAFNGAPTPPNRNASDVVSIFSDAYDNVQVDNYNGFFQFSTTQGGAISIGNENIISYTQLNFVSINMFNSPDVDASEMTHIHVDINVRESIDPSDFIRFQLINNNGPSETSGSVQLGDYAALQEDTWVSYDIPLTDFSGIGNTNDIDLIFFVSDGTISSIYVDNVYFYKQ